MKIWEFTFCDECGEEVECAVMLNGRKFGHNGEVVAIICSDCLKKAIEFLRRNKMAETYTETRNGWVITVWMVAFECWTFRASKGSHMEPPSLVHATNRMEAVDRAWDKVQDWTPDEILRREG